MNLAPPALAVSHRPVMPRCDRRSVELRDQLDLADDTGVQRIEVPGGDPVLQDGLTTYLVDLVAVQERPPDAEAVTYPAPDRLTFQSRAIMVAYDSLSTG